MMGEREWNTHTPCVVNKMKWFNEKFANVIHIIFRQFNSCQGLLTVCVCVLDISNAEMKMKSTSK